MDNNLKLRGNSLLVWIERIRKTKRYRELLEQINLFSTFEINHGIIKIIPSETYLPHNFVPLIEAGYNIVDLSIVLKSEVIFFEHEYGKFNLTDKEIYDFERMVYKFNINKSKLESGKLKLDKELVQMTHTAEVFYYLNATKVKLESLSNGKCSLTFKVNNDKIKNYSTIFNEDEIKLLEKVNNLIQK